MLKYSAFASFTHCTYFHFKLCSYRIVDEKAQEYFLPQGSLASYATASRCTRLGPRALGGHQHTFTTI